MSATAGAGALLGSIVDLNPPDHYIHWGFILISLANFLVIVAMLAVFILALTVPFVHSRRKRARGASGSSTPTGTASAGATATAPAPAPAPADAQAVVATVEAGDDELWTAKARKAWLRHLPPEKMLPDSQPAYVASWIYVFGVLTMVALTVVIATGCILALEGPAWWHISSVGLFVNSLHMWSVECFFAFMAIHLWGKFWMASWRGKRQLTWITGAAAFLVAVFEGFTGYVSQTNLDSQWIAFEAKDAMNGAGIGAFFNTMNFGQALMLHIVFVPLVIVLLVVIHIVMVRLRGVAPPIDALPEHLGTPGTNHAETAPRPATATTTAPATTAPATTSPAPAEPSPAPVGSVLESAITRGGLA